MAGARPGAGRKLTGSWPAGRGLAGSWPWAGWQGNASGRKHLGAGRGHLEEGIWKETSGKHLGKSIWGNASGRNHLGGHLGGLWGKLCGGALKWLWTRQAGKQIELVALIPLETPGVAGMVYLSPPISNGMQKYVSNVFYNVFVRVPFTKSAVR